MSVRYIYQCFIFRTGSNHLGGFIGKYIENFWVVFIGSKSKFIPSPQSNMKILQNHNFLGAQWLINQVVKQRSK